MVEQGSTNMYNDNYTIRVQDFSRYHGKNPATGSTYIRVHQLIKYWPEADIYKYGEKPDVMMYQKVYVTPDYRWPEHYEGIKILDICDPDWFQGQASIVETASFMDAITCPTEKMAEFCRQFHDRVKVIPDRFDLELIPKPRPHKGKANHVVWFGYAHNAEALRYAIPAIERMKLKLTVISNDDPVAYRWGKREDTSYYKFVKYDEDTIYKELQKADFAVLPDNHRPEDVFKSNNKTIKANLAGLPVAKTLDEMELYMDGEARRKWFDENYSTIQEAYDIRKSVEDYKRLIDEIKNE